MDDRIVSPVPVPYNDRAYRWIKGAAGDVQIVPSSLGILAVPAPAPAVPAGPTHLMPLPLRAMRHQRQIIGLITIAPKD